MGVWCASKTVKSAAICCLFIILYARFPNAIEGNTLTLREPIWFCGGLTIDQKPLKDHMEAVGHKEAFDYVSELVKDNVPLSESIIKQIHYLVLADKKDDRGVYRRVPVHIMGAQHEPVQPYLIQPQMEQLLLDYAQSTEHIITKLARFHIDFESSPVYRWQRQNRPPAGKFGTYESGLSAY